MNMTLHSSINGKIIVAHGEVSNEPTEKQRGRDELIKRRSDGALYYLDRIWVPLKGDVRTLIMDETHKSRLKLNIRVHLAYFSNLRSLSGNGRNSNGLCYETTKD
ncbi:hypothetical protein Tco_0077441 [Tanacetum coccineum]